MNYQNRIITPTLLLLFVLSIILININSDLAMQNLIRGIIAFVIVPGWIIYANNNHLWFRKSLRWIANGSRHYIQSGLIFLICMLASYEVSLMIPYGTGFLFHITMLAIGSIVYWAPLLINCSFHKTRPFMHKFAYLILTSTGFVTYHETAFLYYQSTPTLGFMMTGIITMFGMLLFLVRQWASTEKTLDRLTVKGYLRPLSRDR